MKLFSSQPIRFSVARRKCIWLTYQQTLPTRCIGINSECHVYRAPGICCCTDGHTLWGQQGTCFFSTAVWSTPNSFQSVLDLLPRRPCYDTSLSYKIPDCEKTLALVFQKRGLCGIRHEWRAAPKEVISLSTTLWDLGVHFVLSALLILAYYDWRCEGDSNRGVAFHWAGNPLKMTSSTRKFESQLLP